MAVKTAVASMIERAISALYDADPVGGLFAEDLVPRITVTGSEKRSWNVLLDLAESGRVVLAERHPVHGCRYKLSPEELNSEFSRRFHLYKPKEKFVEGGTL